MSLRFHDSDSLQNVDIVCQQFVHDRIPWGMQNADMDAFGDRLRAARERAAFTQEQLGFELGVGKGTISSWELGRTEPSLEDLAGLRRVLQISLDELICGVGQMVIPTPPTLIGRDGDSGMVISSPPRNAARDDREDSLLSRFRILSTTRKNALLELLKQGK